jgi:biopolymer transport protein ExbB
MFSLRFASQRSFRQRIEALGLRFVIALALLLVATRLHAAYSTTEVSLFSSTSWLAQADTNAEVATEPAPEAADARRAQPNPADDLTIGMKQIRQLFEGMAGIPMWALVGSSILLLMFVVDRMVVLQKSRVIPVSFTSRMIQHLRDEDLDNATSQELIDVCRQHGSPIAAFFAIVIENRGRSAFEIRTAVVDQSDSEIYKLKKNTKAIGALANLAPLLGLFGTVIGMIDAFRSLSQQQGGTGKSELLAHGISLALIATASGLGVAIVASVFYYYLQGKFEQRVQEIDALTNQAIALVAGDGRLPPRGVDRPGTRK